MIGLFTFYIYELIDIEKSPSQMTINLLRSQSNRNVFNNKEKIFR